VAADAVNRVRTDLLKRYGADPEGLATAKLSAQQIRNIRNDMGTVADPARTIKPNTRRQALQQIYSVLNKEIDDVAAETRGVNLKDFKARNRQISTLIPVRDSLLARAEAEADFGIMKRAKAAPGNAVRRAIREVAYDVSEAPPVPGAVAGALSRPGGEPAPTRLAPSQEMIYQRWRASLPKELQFEGDYDLRGFFKENPNFSAKPGEHMTDRFKLPNHPTFSNESKYYNDETKHLGGHWDGDVFIPNDPKFKQRVDESGPLASAP